MKKVKVVMVAVSLALAANAPASDSPHGMMADKADQIRKVDAEWSDDLYAGRLDEVMANYDEDAAFLVNNRPIIRGKAAIREWFSERLKTPGYSATFKPNEIVVSEAGDMAYELGEFQATALSDGKQVHVKGKHLVTWKWTGSRWLVTAEAISSDGPPQSS